MPYPPPPKIVLPHPWVIGEFRLRPPESKDVHAITEALQAVDIQRHTRVPSPYNLADAETYVRIAAEGLADSSAVSLVITDPPGGGLYGAVGLTIDWRDAQAEVGYWLHRGARGKGLVTRAVAELCRFGFGLGVGRILLRASAANPASAAVADRLGFTLEGTSRKAAIDGPAGDLTAPRVDMLEYGLLPEEMRGP